MPRFISLLSTVVLFGAAAFAQTTSTSILGTVTDPTGASVANAKVTAKNVATGVSSVTQTTGTGDYTLPLLNVGEYEVTVESPGFKVETKGGIRLQVNEKVRADFQLQIGSQTETVTVKAEATNLRTDEASIGGTVEQRRLVELPINGRNVGNFAVLNPGVGFGFRGGYDGQTGSGGGVPIPGMAIAIVANGQRETNMHATLDGVVATEARVNTVPFSPSPEAIEEVKVLTGSYSAEYGTNSGAQLIMIMRAGTNDYHGAAYEFLRNNKFDAEDYFQNYFLAPGAARSPKPDLRQNQFGFVLGGPVWIPKLYKGTNRTFFMFNFEGRRRRLPGAISSSLVPSDAMRGGDFGQLLNRRSASGAALPAVTIVDPTSDPNAPTAFTNNLIPTARIAAGATALLNFIPKAQNSLPDPLTGVNLRNPGTNSIDDNQYFVRVDHVFSASDRVFYRYATNIPSWFSITTNPNFSYLVDARNQNHAGQWLHIFGPTVVNEARLGYTTSRDDSFNPRANTTFNLDTIGIHGFNVINDGNRALSPREAGVPAMNIAPFLSLAERDGGNGFDQNQTIQFGDNVSISTGAHSFKAGFDFRRVILFRGAANVPRGDFNFNGDVTGNSFAAFLLGAPTSSDSPEGLPLTDVRQNRIGIYFQDDWKATRKLTLNLGLRWEYNTAATDITGLWRSGVWKNGLSQPIQFVPDQIRTVFQFYDPSKKQFQPRVGLAYRVTDNWVVRSGFGIYYNVHQLNNYTILNLNPPLSGSSAFANTIRSGVYVPGAPLYNFNNPFGAANPASAVSANVLNTDNFQPYVTQWTFDVQRRLPWQTTLTVGYVGNKSTHVDSTQEKDNPLPFTPTSSTDTIQSRRPYPFILDNGVLRPLTRMRFLDTGANAWYQGLQVSLKKELSRGFLFTLAYTYSKAEMEGYGRNEGDGINNQNYQDPRNRAAEKGRIGFDSRHVAVMSFLYNVPMFTSWSKGIAGAALSGWQTNGIVTLRSGFPFTIYQGNIINSGNTPVRPDRIDTGASSNPTVNQWFNPDAFHIVSCASAAIPQTCHYGSAGNAILDGPGFKNVDFSMFKNFRLGERFKLQFRGEFFNLFNTPQFFVPNRTMNTSGGFQPVSASGNVTWPSQANIVNGPGAISSLISPMRNIQFGLKLIW
jgi:hypothetical protein